MNEYQRRLNAWARTLTNQTFPDDALASIDAWSGGGCGTCGPDAGIEVHIGNTLVHEFRLYELPAILEALFSVSVSA